MTYSPQTVPHSTFRAQGKSRLAAIASGFPSRLVATMNRWRQRRRQRLTLGELPPKLLADLGLSIDDVRRECAKPFWR